MSGILKGCILKLFILYCSLLLFAGRIFVFKEMKNVASMQSALIMHIDTLKKRGDRCRILPHDSAKFQFLSKIHLLSSPPEIVSSVSDVFDVWSGASKSFASTQWFTARRVAMQGGQRLYSAWSWKWGAGYLSLDCMIKLRFTISSNVCDWSNPCLFHFFGSSFLMSFDPFNLLMQGIVKQNRKWLQVVDVEIVWWDCVWLRAFLF